MSPLGLPDFLAAKAHTRVTTHITVVSEEDGGLDIGAAEGEIYRVRVPENAITVTRNTVRAVDEVRGEWMSAEMGKSTSGGEEGTDRSASVSVRESLQRTSSGTRSESEEGLFTGKCY